MTLYLDNSFLNRPFDDPQIRINGLEGEVLFLILDLAEKGNAQLSNSSVIEYENSLNPFLERRMFVETILDKTKTYQNLNAQIEKRAKQLIQDFRITPIDALHLATAEYAHVDFFITCDYNLIRKYRGNIRVVTPLEFLTYYENSNSN